MADLPQTEVHLDPGPIESAFNSVAKAAKLAKKELGDFFGKNAINKNEDLTKKIERVRKETDRTRSSLRGMLSFGRRAMNNGRGVASLAEGPGAAPGLLSGAGRMAGMAGPVGMGIGIGLAASRIATDVIQYRIHRAEAERAMSDTPLQRELRNLPNTPQNKEKLARESLNAAEIRRQTGRTVKMHRSFKEELSDYFGIGQPWQAQQKELFNAKVNAQQMARALGYPEHEVQAMTKVRTTGGNNDAIRVRRQAEEHWLVSSITNAANVFGDKAASSTQRALVDLYYSSEYFDKFGGGPGGYNRALAQSSELRREQEMKNEMQQRMDHWERADKYFNNPTSSYRIMETRRQKRFLWQIQRPKVPVMRRD